MPSSSQHPIQPARQMSCGCCSFIGIVILAGAAFLCFSSSGAFTSSFASLGGLFSGLAGITHGGEIAFGQTVSGTTGLVGSHDWTFYADEGQAVSIMLNAQDDDYDTYLYLLDSNGNELAHDDDSGEGFNSQLVCVRLPYSGTYAARVSGFADDTGSYQLTLKAIEDGGIQVIEYGETIEGRLNGCPAEFTFQGTRNQLIRITAESDSFDGTLRLYAPDGVEIAYNDESSGLNPEISGVFLPADGLYRVVLADLGGDNNMGTYVLRLRLEEQ